ASALGEAHTLDVAVVAAERAARGREVQEDVLLVRLEPEPVRVVEPERRLDGAREIALEPRAARFLQGTSLRRRQASDELGQQRRALAVQGLLDQRRDRVHFVLRARSPERVAPEDHLE